MRKKLDAIQSNPRVFATLVLDGANGYYIYRLLGGIDGLEVQVSRVFATKKEAADHMFLKGDAWAGIHDHVSTDSHQQDANAQVAAVQGFPPPQPMQGQPRPGYPPQQGRVVNGRRPVQRPGAYQGAPQPMPQQYPRDGGSAWPAGGPQPAGPKRR